MGGWLHASFRRAWQTPGPKNRSAGHGPGPDARPEPGAADVVFQNCLPVAGGGITCDTRPEGNTLMNDEAARYGLLDQASPGWDEFEPYQGYDDMFGGNET